VYDSNINNIININNNNNNDINNVYINVKLILMCNESINDY